MHKFGTGSLATLGKYKSDVIGAKLRKFYQRHYHATNMRLAVYGKQNVTTLRQWVQGFFAAVPTIKGNAKAEAKAKARAKAYKKASDWHNIFPEQHSGVEVLFESVKKAFTMSIVWPIPSQIKKYKTKPATYIGVLLGNGNPGSLQSVLQRKGWVRNVGPGRATRPSTAT